ncbi:winged helix-turn-helix transcriptional regulator [Oceanicaulis sp. AH-315-P02]|nr:winged helix-turn-helix transcriptional regulator [Robiginitomaculum sp.]MBN4047867.1 winged helix-turn-helix transcriptional regulator [Oceanicaulis sp. AH-315-P02]
MSNVFKAISDNTRREILRLLREKPLSAGEISAHFPVSKPTMSAHFSVLREAGLVTTHKQGKMVIYQINMSVLEDALLGFSGAIGLGLHSNTQNKGNKNDKS